MFFLYAQAAPDLLVIHLDDVFKIRFFLDFPFRFFFESRTCSGSLRRAPNKLGTPMP